MEKAYKQYFDVLPCYVSIQDRDFRIIDANNRFINDFGDGIGDFCYKIYKQRNEKCEFCPVELTMRDGRRYGSEEVVQTRNGKMVSVVVYTTPVLNDKGEIVAVMEMSTDVSELKILQQRLHESQERYRLLFDEAPCYISIQDRDFNLVEVNRRFREDFGNISGGKCYEVYKHRCEICDPCPVDETFKDGDVHESEEVVRSKNGDNINVLCTAAPLRDSYGKITSVMEMSTNITQIRQLQSQLASIGLLISSISHGLKGLLNGLDGGIYLVNSGFDKNNEKRVKQGWEMVQRNVTRIRSMVMDILYYAKDREPQCETLNTSIVLEEIGRILSKKAQDMGIEFVQNVDPGIEQFEADFNALRAMLVNITENSFDACRVDSVKQNHRVDMTVEGNEHHIIFEIKDNGIGMDTETKDKIFTLFYSSKGTEGTGLGLFIANQIAKQHNGKIDVDSSPGKGTTFKITLPRNQAKSKVKIAKSGDAAVGAEAVS